MAGRSAVLAIKILADSTQARKGMGEVERTADNTTGKVSSHFKKMAGIIAGAFSLTAGFDFLKDSVQGYQDHLKILDQTSQVIKTTGGAAKVTADHVSGLADHLEQYTGLDGDVIQSGANMLLTFTNIRNEVGKGNDVFDQATSIVTDMSAALGTDLKGQAVQVGKALNDPIKGISALSRVGVTFTEKQKAVIKSLVDSGNSLGAQKVILKELNKEFGGTAHAIETPSQKMQVALRGLQDSIGALLLPFLQFAEKVLGQYVIPALQATVGWVQKNAKILGVVALALAPIIAAWAAYSAITKVVAIAQATLNAVMEANPMVLIATLIAAVVVALVVLWNKSKTFRDIVKGVWKTVGAVIRGAWRNVIQPVWNALKTAIRVVWSVIQTNIRLIQGLFRGVSAAAHTAFSAVKTAIGWVGTAIHSAWSTVSSVGGKVVGFFRDLPGKIGGFASGMLHAGEHLIGALWDGIKSAISGAWDFAVNIAKSVVNAIISGLNSLLGLPWQIQLHIPIPLAPDVNFGPYTLLPSIPLWGSAADAAQLLPPMPDLGDLQPGFTLLAAAMNRPWSANIQPNAAERAQHGNVIVKNYFQGIVPNPEATARQIKTVLNRSDQRNGRTRTAV